MGFFKSLLKSIAPPDSGEKPGTWLVEYARILNGNARAPDHDDEEGFIDGTSDDGMPWTLRVLERAEADGDIPVERHRVLWQTDAFRRDHVVLVFGSAHDDADRWLGLDGINVRADQHLARLDSAFAGLEQLVGQVQSGALSNKGFVERLSTAGDGAPMTAFMRTAEPFPLPHPLAGPWHALTTDAVFSARVLTPAVIARIEAWRASGDTHDGWIRVWVGAPNVRVESYLVDATPSMYASTIEVGLALARAARDVERHSTR